MQQYSVKYIIGFAAAVCLACSVVVSLAAVGLKDKQKENERLDIQKKVLTIAGLSTGGSNSDIQTRFSDNIQSRLVALTPGGCKDVDVKTYDMAKAMKNPALSISAPSNPGKIRWIPKCAVIYEHIISDDSSDESAKTEGNEGLEMYILPIQGKGLWSTLYGYIAIGSDGRTIEGLSFYKHGETPGLGGEVDAASFKNQWPGKDAYLVVSKNDVKLAITVRKNGTTSANSTTEIDGLAGATITTNGVNHLVRFWLGECGFGPFLCEQSSFWGQKQGATKEEVANACSAYFSTQSKTNTGGKCPLGLMQGGSK